jgi:hypothetical protein
MCVTIAEHEFLDKEHKIGDFIPLSTMMLEVEVDGRLYATDLNINWGHDDFKADMKFLQENGVRGYVVVDLGGGEFVRFKLTDEGVEQAAGRVYFTDDQELTLGPLMVRDDDIDNLAEDTDLSEEDQEYLKEHIDELGERVCAWIMESYAYNVIQDEATNMLAEREIEE